MTDIVVPAGLWSEGDNAVIGSWLYSDGDMVQDGAVVADIMVEKTSYELIAPAGGRLSIAVPEEGEIQPGQVVGRIV